MYVFKVGVFPARLGYVVMWRGLWVLGQVLTLYTPPVVYLYMDRFRAPVARNWSGCRLLRHRFHLPAQFLRRARRISSGNGYPSGHRLCWG